MELLRLKIIIKIFVIIYLSAYFLSCGTRGGTRRYSDIRLAPPDSNEMAQIRIDGVYLHEILYDSSSNGAISFYVFYDNGIFTNYTSYIEGYKLLSDSQRNVAIKNNIYNTVIRMQTDRETPSGGVYKISNGLIYLNSYYYYVDAFNVLRLYLCIDKLLMKIVNTDTLLLISKQDLFGGDCIYKNHQYTFRPTHNIPLPSKSKLKRMGVKLCKKVKD